MGRALRLGVVGLGSVFEPYSRMIRALRDEGRIVVTRVCDVAADRSARAERFLGPGAAFTTDFRDVVAADDVDAVLVITSMAEHGSIATAALQAGKHVLVEKPMSIELPEAARMIEVASEQGVVLICAPHIVLSATYRAIWKRVVHRGEIGRIHLARARYGWSGPWWGPWFYSTGGGPLFDLGVYNVTALTGLLGPVKRVTAFAGTAIPERVVDGQMTKVETADNFQVLLDFGGATFAVVTTGFTMQKYRSPAIELYGGDGTVQLMGDDWAPDGYEVWTNDRGAWSVYGETDRLWQWTAGLRHLTDVVLDGAQQLVRPDHAFHALEVMIKAGQAARTGIALEIDSVHEPVPFDPDAIELKGEASHDDRIVRETGASSNGAEDLAAKGAVQR